MGNRKVADRLIATPLFSSEDRSLPGAAGRSRLLSRQQGSTEYPAVKIRELAELGFRELFSGEFLKGWSVDEVSLCVQHRVSLVSALHDGSMLLDRSMQCMHISVVNVEFRASELIEMIAKIIQFDI